MNSFMLVGYIIIAPIGAVVAYVLIEKWFPDDPHPDKCLVAGLVALLWPVLGITLVAVSFMWLLGRFGDICSRGCKALMAVRKATKKPDVLEGRID